MRRVVCGEVDRGIDVLRMIRGGRDMRRAPHRVWLSARRLVVSILLLLGAGTAVAHAEYASSDPVRDAVLEAPPERVRVTFTEEVETRFSLFKIYRLEHPSLQGASLVEPDFLRLNGLAVLLVNDVLQVRDDAGVDARADLGLVDAPARTEEVVLGVRADLGPGAYVVMWRVLAEDTHPTQGHFVFVVTPEDGQP